MKNFKRYSSNKSINSAARKKERYETSSKNTNTNTDGAPIHSKSNSTAQSGKWKAFGMVRSISKERSYNELKYEIKPVETQQAHTG